jgi:transposase
LANTNMAKSVLDAGWSGFTDMLSYKAITHGGMCLEVHEAYGTQTRSECGCIAGPKGCAGLNERMWQRSKCGAVHNRDTNSAKNILRVGLCSLEEPMFEAGKPRPSGLGAVTVSRYGVVSLAYPAPPRVPCSFGWLSPERLRRTSLLRIPAEKVASLSPIG